MKEELEAGLAMGTKTALGVPWGSVPVSPGTSRTSCSQESRPRQPWRGARGGVGGLGLPSCSCSAGGERSPPVLVPPAVPVPPRDPISAAFVSSPSV